MSTGNHRESPCGRSAEGTTQGARPSEEGWDRSECRFETSSLELSRSATAPRRFRDASATGTRPIRDASATAARHNRDASVPAHPEIRLTNLTTYNQRARLPLGGTFPPLPSGQGQPRKRVSTRQVRRLRPHLPKRGAGAQPPSGVQRVPLYPKTLEGGWWDNGARHISPLPPFCPCPGARGQPREGLPSLPPRQGWRPGRRAPSRR